jgi:hypothetical protein
MGVGALAEHATASAAAVSAIGARGDRRGPAKKGKNRNDGKGSDLCTE